MAVVYQVIEWDRHFENFKSRSVARCGFVCVPNKQHGEGITYILSQPDGLSVYGVWNLILGACSQHEADPKATPQVFRDGWLTNDGTPTGKAWAASALAIRWRRTEKEISRALQVLCCPEVGFIAAHLVSDAGYQTDTTKPLNGIELKGIEGNRREERSTACSEPEVPASEPVALLVFPTTGKGSKTWNLCEDYLTELSSAFPERNVLAESRKALAWVNASPGRKKTDRGMKRFLVGWMGRAQNRGLGHSNGNVVPAAEELDPADAAMIEQIYPSEK